MKRWHLVVILGQIFIIVAYMSDFGAEPTDESIWCEIYRPELTFNECSIEFGY
jgi:hypothetical protein